MAGKNKSVPPPLSLREIRFCKQYAERGNATRAYIDAGYPHATENAAGYGAWALLKKPKIREYIRELREVAADAAKVTVAMVVRGLARSSFADRRKILDKTGRLLPPHKWPDDVAACIEGIETEEILEHRPDADGRKRKVVAGYVRKVRTAKRTEAQKLLGQFLGMFKDADQADPTAEPAVIEIPDNGRS